MEVIHKIGRRKTSVARVYMSKGKGAITVNKKPYSEFFDTSSLQYKVLQPFALTNTKDQFDLSVTVKGGGINGQAEAIRLAIPGVEHTPPIIFSSLNSLLARYFTVFDM